MKSRKYIFITLIIALSVLVAMLLASCNGDALDSPSDVSINADSMTVSWSSVTDADHYMLAFNGDTSRQFMTAERSYSLTNAPSQVIALLQSGKENLVQVRAVNFSEKSGVPENCSEWSKSVSFIFTKQLPTVSRFSFDEDANTVKWRSLKESGAKYKLVIREKGSETNMVTDLSDYTLSPNATTGLIVLDITDILTELDNKEYEISIIGYLEGYDDSEYATFASVDLTDGVPDPGVDPDPDIDPEPSGTLESVQAFYTGGDIIVGSSLALGKITLIATYSDGLSQTVYGFTTNFDNFKNNVGTHSVTVTYVEDEVTKTATVNISVIEDEEEPEEPKPPQIAGYAILGVGGDWTNGIQMTVNPENSNEYMYSGLTANGTDVIKVYNSGNYYNTLKSEVSASIYSFDELGNIKLVAGSYDIYFDTVAKTLFIGVAGASNPDPPLAVYIRGKGNDWTNGIQMTVNPEKATEYMYQGLALNGTDKIKINIGEAWYGKVKSGVAVSYSNDTEGNIILAAGTYDLYFDTANKDEGIWIAAHTA